MTFDLQNACTVIKLCDEAKKDAVPENAPTLAFILLFTYEQSKKDKKNRLKEIYIDKNYLLIPCPTLHFGWKVSIDQSLRK